MSTPEQEIGARLKEVRRRRGVSQADLGAAIGLDQSAIHRTEAGERKIQVAEMIEACEHLCVPLDDLLEPERASVALRADAAAEDIEVARRTFRRVIDDFFAFEAAAR